jgi:hypothetical protein
VRSFSFNVAELRELEELMSPRQRVTSEELTEILVAEASVFLGRDARFMAPHMKVSRHAGAEPNWDVKLGLFGSVVVREMFNKARERTKMLYDLE